MALYQLQCLFATLRSTAKKATTNSFQTSVMSFDPELKRIWFLQNIVNICKWTPNKDASSSETPLIFYHWKNEGSCYEMLAIFTILIQWWTQRNECGQPWRHDKWWVAGASQRAFEWKEWCNYRSTHKFRPASLDAYWVINVRADAHVPTACNYL